MARARSAPKARLGGQAEVKSAAGTWKDLTGNVNPVAANLTTRVRANTAWPSGVKLKRFEDVELARRS